LHWQNSSQIWVTLNLELPNDRHLTPELVSNIFNTHPIGIKWEGGRNCQTTTRSSGYRHHQSSKSVFLACTHWCQEMEEVKEISGTSTQLKTINLTNIVTNVEVLEFGPTLSWKSYIVAREVYSNKLVTGSVKSSKERKNVNSKFRSDWTSF
jgi:hypothetical protein